MIFGIFLFRPPSLDTNLKTTNMILSETGKCKICLKTFCNQSYLQKHIESAHDQVQKTPLLKNCKCKRKCSHNPQRKIVQDIPSGDPK